jgi:hypothetical protein
LFWEFDAELEIHRGKLLDKPREHRGKHVTTYHKGRPNGEGTGEAALEHCDVLLKDAETPQRFFCVAAKPLPSRCQPALVRLPVRTTARKVRS